MSVQRTYYAYLIVLIIISVLAVITFKKNSFLGKGVVLLLVATAVTELVSRITFAFDLGKSPAYHFFNVIELQVVSVFFFRGVLPRYFRSASAIAAVVYAILAVLNCVFLQPIKVLNSNFIELESFLIIAMSIYSLYRIFIDDDIKRVTYYQRFWVWTCLFMYATSTFLFWPSIKFIYREKLPFYNAVVCGQIIVNIICYLGLGLTLIFHRKLQKDVL